MLITVIFAYIFFHEEVLKFININECIRSTYDKEMGFMSAQWTNVLEKKIKMNLYTMVYLKINYK